MSGDHLEHQSENGQATARIILQSRWPFDFSDYSALNDKFEMELRIQMWINRIVSRLSGLLDDHSYSSSESLPLRRLS